MVCGSSSDIVREHQSSFLTASSSSDQVCWRWGEGITATCRCRFLQILYRRFFKLLLTNCRGVQVRGATGQERHLFRSGRNQKFFPEGSDSSRASRASGFPRRSSDFHPQVYLFILTMNFYDSPVQVPWMWCVSRLPSGCVLKGTFGEMSLYFILWGRRPKTRFFTRFWLSQTWRTNACRRNRFSLQFPETRWFH